VSTAAASVLREPSHGVRRDERDDAIRRYLPLVRRVARRYADAPEPLEDLVQAGVVGLIAAVDRFDRARGFELGALAAPWIEGEIRRHLRDRAPAVRPPRRVHELRLALVRHGRALDAELQRPPTLMELAEAAGASAVEAGTALESVHAIRPLPLDELAETTADDPFAASDARLDLAAAVRRLDPRSRRLLQLRVFGLSQAEIASQLGISQPHVSRLLAGALATLRSVLDEGV
jgi:RNA polymerase sigma-B factor